jgi:hypothetical protein
VGGGARRGSAVLGGIPAGVAVALSGPTLRNTDLGVRGGPGRKT